MEKKKEEYSEKAINIFNLLNQFRANPRQLARHLEKLKKYLDKTTNILSEPNKIQIQMIEGEKVINEAIKFLKSLSAIPPLEWDENLAKSAQEHVDDIGPKGIISYESSDGTEAEERITKYGSYIDSLGENIDFGPNDEIDVIVFMTLDDGEVERPHRGNLFKEEFKKIGVACGPHETEYYMCVMDFASEFFPRKPKKNINNDYLNNYIDVTENQIESDYDIKYALLMEKLKKMNNENNNSKNKINSISMSNKFNNSNSNNLHIIDEEQGNQFIGKMSTIDIMNNFNVISEVEELKQKVKDIYSRKPSKPNKKIVQKKIEIFTTITYKMEDGSTRIKREVKTRIING